MRITSLEVTEAARLTDFYNERFADGPYYYRVTPEEFESGVRFQYWLDEPHPELSEERLVVGEEAGKTVGVSHVAKRTSEGREFGTIRFFDYEPGSRAVAEALLRESERHVRELGLSEIWACGGPRSVSYRFHRLGWGATFTNMMGHIRGLFGISGYRLNLSGEEQLASRSFMAAPLDDTGEPVLPDPGAEIRTEFWTGNGQRPNLKVHAYREGREIGIADCWSMGERTGAPAAQDTFYLGGLAVKEEERRKGLGRYLMQRMHWEMQRKGYRTATLHTSIENYRTHLLASSLGYRVVDTTITFVKKLDR